MQLTEARGKRFAIGGEGKKGDCEALKEFARLAKRLKGSGAAKKKAGGRRR